MSSAPMWKRINKVGCFEEILGLAQHEKAHHIAFVFNERKEVIRCRVISFSKAWPQRIALAKGSPFVGEHDARLVIPDENPAGLG